MLPGSQYLTPICNWRVGGNRAGDKFDTRFAIINRLEIPSAQRKYSNKNVSLQVWYKTSMFEKDGCCFVVKSL